MSQSSGDTVNEQKAAALREQLREACVASTKATLEVARLLYEVYYTTTRVGKVEVSLAEAWGFESFDEYVEHELHMHMGPAHALIEVWDELYTRRSFQPGQLPNSITKLKLLARLSRRYPNDNDIKPWLAKAADLSCCEFQDEFDALIFGRGRKRAVSFSFKTNAAKQVLQRVATAKEVFGVTTNGEALAKIVEEWSEMMEKTANARRLKAG